MRIPKPLPPELLTKYGFTTMAAREAGVAQHRLFASDLFRSFHGVRTLTPPRTISERAFALGLRLGPGQAVSGLAAAHLWGLPLPSRYRTGIGPIEVLTKRSVSRVRLSNVTTRSIRDDRFRSVDCGGVPVVSPVLALVTSAARIGEEGAIMMLDALMTGSNLYPNLRVAPRPHLVPDQLAGLLRHYKGMRGMRLLRAASERARPGSESPMETVLRLRLIDAGLPEPTIQHDIVLAGGVAYRADLAYEFANVLIDYEGEHHVLDRRVFGNDLLRGRALHEAGMHHYRVVAEDLIGDRFMNLVASIRRRLREAPP